jgi:hypothetical protein
MGLDLPAWMLQYLGTVPQWGMFFLLLIVFIRTSPDIMKAWFEQAKAKREQHGNRITELEAQVKECREECDKVHADYRKEILGLQAQSIQEQLSLVSIIMQTVDNPMLHQLFEQLQRHKAAQPVEFVGGPIEDSGK